MAFIKERYGPGLNAEHTGSAPAFPRFPWVCRGCNGQSPVASPAVDILSHIGYHGRLMTDRQEERDMARPFAKWVGGKGQLLPEIRRRYPSDLGTPSRSRYVEPFVGGGAVLFDVLGAYPSLSEIHANDLNRELINAYLTTRDDVDSLIGLLRDDFAPSYLPLDHDGRAQVFYGWRRRLNELIDAHSGDGDIDADGSVYGTDSVEQAALFLSLLRTCFNGLCRYNGDGHFNTPHGRYRNPSICDEERLRECSEALRPVTFHWGSYDRTRDLIDGKTFVYADPPYREIPGKPSFTAYQKSGFNDDSQRELATFLRACKDDGAKVLTSNSDPHNGDPDDDFFDELYSWATVERVYARRAINSKGDGRGSITEVLISA